MVVSLFKMLLKSQLVTFFLLFLFFPPSLIELYIFVYRFALISPSSWMIWISRPRRREVKTPEMRFVTSKQRQKLALRVLLLFVLCPRFIWIYLQRHKTIPSCIWGLPGSRAPECCQGTARRTRYLHAAGILPQEQVTKARCQLFFIQQSLCA